MEPLNKPLKQLIVEALKNLEGFMETGADSSYHSYDRGRYDTYHVVLGWINQLERENGEVPTEV
jgi:hypothetical protein